MKRCTKCGELKAAEKYEPKDVVCRECRKVYPKRKRKS